MAVETTVSSFDRIESILRSDEVYELARLIPQRVEGDGGRPCQYHLKTDPLCPLES